MIGYTTIGVSNMDSACKFYAALLGELGGSQLFGMDRIQFFGTSPEAPMLAVCVPYNEEAPAPGNGNMVAFPGGSKEGAAEMYSKALELGASCDGEPGQRVENMFYGAYAKDADDNKLCFYDFS